MSSRNTTQAAYSAQNSVCTTSIRASGPASRATLDRSSVIMVMPRKSDSAMVPMISVTRSSSFRPRRAPPLRMSTPVARHHRKLGRLTGASSTSIAR
ncbi:hypothetical protein D3C73_935240 [compost metagenome]